MTVQPARLAEIQYRTRVMAAERIRRAGERWRTYYPDCTAACRNPRSPDKADHAALCRALYGRHLDFFRASAKHTETLFLGANRVGKALKHGTPVLTPKGWVSIEQLHVGDEVIGGDGNPCYVTGVYPQGVRPIVRLVFDDGASVECDPDHLWKCRQGRERYDGERSWHVRSTMEILQRGGASGNAQRVAEIPVASAYLSSQGQLPVDPYLLGLMAGDGCYTGRSGGMPSFSTNDAELINAFMARYPSKKTGKYDYRLAGGLVTDLKFAGVWGKRSWEKTIPREYLWNSGPARLDLLRGLMDTDGSADKKGRAIFYSTSTGLVEAVVFLTRSLGGKAKVSPKQTYFYQRGRRIAGRPSWVVHVTMPVCPFLLERKANRWRRLTARGYYRRLVSAEPCESASATCIAVDSNDQTYITKDFIVTHNTDAAAYALTCHLSGEYPHWWRGKRFPDAITAWVVGDTMQTTRNILQVALLGPIDSVDSQEWSGMIPRDRVVGKPTRRSGSVAMCLDTVRVAHRSGKVSQMQFLSYDQGRRTFQGTSKSVVWLDEEPPDNEDIYSECLTRTLDVQGIVMMTFTPLRGYTAFLSSYCETATYLDRDGSEAPASGVFGVSA